MRKFLAWIFLIIGSLLLGIGQTISEEAYVDMVELLVDNKAVK